LLKFWLFALMSCLPIPYSPLPIPLCVEHRRAHAMLPRLLNRLFVSGVDVTDDAHPRIGRQYALQPARRVMSPVGDHDHSGVQRIADAHAASVMDRDPRSP